MSVVKVELGLPAGKRQHILSILFATVHKAQKRHLLQRFSVGLAMVHQPGMIVGELGGQMSPSIKILRAL